MLGLIFGLPSRLAASVALLSSGRIRLPLPEQIDLNSSFRRARVGADGGAEIVYISNESLLVILVVGLVAGWLAGKIVRGSGFGLIGDIAIGIHWRLVASSNRYSSRHGNCLGNRQRHHWRRPATVGRPASARGWPLWRLWQTPVVVAASCAT